MKKHPTPILLLLCTILLIGGTAVAYCNTRSFGFEPDAKWITYNDGGFTVYDFRVEYRQLAEGWESFSNFFPKKSQTSVYKGYKQDKIEMRGDRAEMSDFPLYLNTVAGGLDRRDQTIGGFSFVVKIYAVPVVEIIG